MKVDKIISLINSGYSVEVWSKLDDTCGSFFPVSADVAIEKLTMFGVDCFIRCEIEDKVIYLG